MAYFKMNGTDYSMYVNQLKITTEAKYTSQETAGGNTVVDYINKKRAFEVGIIPLNAETMKELKKDIESFNVTVSFLNPDTNELEENIQCILPQNEVEYYTIQANKTSFKAFTINLIEL